MSWARTSQIAALGTTSGASAPRVTQIAMLAVYGPPESKRAFLSQLVGLATVANETTARVTQVAALAVYTTGIPAPSRRRAWAFDFDGHAFYVLDLGQEGTFAFDLTTGTWCEFATTGYDTWNMRNGTLFNGKVTAGDSINPIVWQLDPDQPLDEGWRTVAHIVTGLIDVRNRKAMRHDALRLTASVGQLGEATGAEIRMRFSDDFGKTWTDYFTIALVDKAYTQELAWRSLGPISAPGRVIEISDTAGPIRIDGCDAEIEGLSDGEQPGGQGGKPG
jgi:hypothetical protein